MYYLWRLASSLLNWILTILQHSCLHWHRLCSQSWHLAMRKQLQILRIRPASECSGEL